MNLYDTITLLVIYYTEAPINPNQLTRKYELAVKIHLLACKEFDYPLYTVAQHLVRSYSYIYRI